MSENMNKDKNYQKIGNRIALVVGCLLIIFSIFLLILMERDGEKLKEMQIHSEQLQQELEELQKED